MDDLTGNGTPAAMGRLTANPSRDHIRISRVDPRCDDALTCLNAYYAELAARFEQGFDVNLSADPDATAMIPPRGAFLVALAGDSPVGCVGLKGGRDYAEVKRLWIAPAARRMGLGRRLMAEIESQARELGIGLLRLDTNSALPEALTMYRRLGWTEIPRFNDDPYPDHFFEKRLDPAG